MKQYVLATLGGFATMQRLQRAKWWLMLLLIWPCAANMQAQSVVHRMYLFDMGLVITASAGPTVSFTDIKAKHVFPTIQPQNEVGFTLQGSINWNVNTYFAMGGQIAYATISGAKSNLRFDASLIEGNLSINFNPFRLIVRYRSDQRWDPYLIVGVGLSYYNSKLSNISENEVIAKRGYGQGGGIFGLVIEGVAIGGAGIKFKINNNWFIRFESANRWMNDDHLDTFQSTNSSPYDFYNLTTLGVSYKIFKERHYPMIRN